PLAGTASGGYDDAEPQGPWEPYQDYGHNHWHNSLIWGEGIHDISIAGPGLIYGKGLSFGAGPGRGQQSGLRGFGPERPAGTPAPTAPPAFNPARMARRDY